MFYVRAGLASARAMVARRRGRWFEPPIADAFLAIADDDPLWAELSGEDVHLDRLGDHADQVLRVDDQRLDEFALAFADVIDAKSAWTAQHTSLANGIGQRVGIDAVRLRDLRRMGLLHDMGMLAIPNSVLDKPGKLTDEEFALIRSHPRHTEEILSRVGVLSRLAQVAAAHHERLDGRGYHRGIAISGLPHPGRRRRL